MNDDNSLLAEICHEWGKEKDNYKVGKWGHYMVDEDRLYNHPAFALFRAHWLLAYNHRIECDDYNDKIILISAGDFWKIYAR